MFLTRRDLGRTVLSGALTGIPLAASGIRYKGVRLGVGSYSFRGLTMNDILHMIPATGANGIELEAPFVEPAGISREALREWRLTSSLDDLRLLRRKLKRAGVQVYAYSVPLNDSFTDEEINRVLAMARTLGAPVFNTPATLSLAERLAGFAERHRMPIGLHTSTGPATPESVGTGESYRKALAISPWLRANLDLYLFKGWGADPVAFVREIHERISTIHFHDRKANRTPQTWVPLGEGDAPTRELLLLAQREKYGFAFSVERIYNVPAPDYAAEIRRGLEYCKGVLDGRRSA